MNKLVAKFTNSEGSRLTVFAKNGKRGVNVGASLKAVGEPRKPVVARRSQRKSRAPKHGTL